MVQQKSRAWWRPWVSGLFIAVAAVSLIGAAITRYAERNILNTNGYLAIVGPLPKDPQVSGALTKFTTDKIFDSGTAQASLTEFLPPKLAPLSSPLADTLEKRINQGTEDFIQSDVFDTIWTTANKAMQTAVVRIAESKEGEGKLAAVGSLDLSKMVSAVRERFGSEEVALTSQQQTKIESIQINLHQRVERLRTTFKAINTGAYVLPYLAAAALLAAIAVAYNRRRTTLAIGIVVVLLAVAMLLAFKITSGNLLGEITDPTYKSAASAVYEAFYGDLRTRLLWAAAAGGVIGILAILAGPYQWALRLRAKFGLDKIKNLGAYEWARNVRKVAKKYEPWLDVAGATAAIMWLLVLSALTAPTLVVILSLLIAYISLLHLIAQPSPSKAAA